MDDKGLAKSVSELCKSKILKVLKDNDYEASINYIFPAYVLIELDRLGFKILKSNFEGKGQKCGYTYELLKDKKIYLLSGNAFTGYCFFRYAEKYNDPNNGWIIIKNSSKIVLNKNNFTLSFNKFLGELSLFDSHKSEIFSIMNSKIKVEKDKLMIKKSIEICDDFIRNEYKKN